MFYFGEKLDRELFLIEYFWLFCSCKPNELYKLLMLIKQKFIKHTASACREAECGWGLGRWSGSELVTQARHLKSPILLALLLTLTAPLPLHLKMSAPRVSGCVREQQCLDADT